MQTLFTASRAYEAASGHRGQRAQEAEVFRRATAALQAAQSDRSVASRTRAIADNDRLWLTVIGLMRDPENLLPVSLRAAIISVGLAVQREMQRPAPDLGFLISVNDNIAAGLAAG